MLTLLCSGLKDRGVGEIRNIRLTIFVSQGDERNQEPRRIRLMCSPGFVKGCIDRGLGAADIRERSLALEVFTYLFHILVPT